MLEFNFLEASATDQQLTDSFDFMYGLYEPFIVKGKQTVGVDNPFTSIFNFIKTIKMKDKSTPDENFIMLDRAHLGVYMKAKKWGAAIDWLSMIEEYQGKYNVSGFNNEHV
jgi:hypothetical protein